MATSTVNEAIAAFPRRRVASLAGVAEGRLDYWDKTGVISPTVAEPVTSHRSVRIYDYGDTLSVMVIAELRRRDLSLQHIRQVVQYLRRLKFRPSEVVFAIAGSRVHFQLPNGQWEDVRELNQLVLHEVLDLEPIKAKIEATMHRSPKDVGKVERRRGTFGSKAVIAGTRIPVTAIRAYLDRGFDTNRILKAYPDLVSGDVEAVRQLATA